MVVTGPLCCGDVLLMSAHPADHADFSLLLSILPEMKYNRELVTVSGSMEA